MNIFLVEDSPSIRRLLVRRLRQMPGMNVIGEAEGETRALSLIRWTRPDMVMMDLSLAEGSGLHLLSELRRGGFAGHVAVLTSQEADTYRRLCLEAGADTFYDKAGGLETLFDDIVDTQPQDRGASEALPTVSLRDGLTGLCNDVALAERLDQSVREAMHDGVDLAVYALQLKGLDDLLPDQADALVLQVAEHLRAGCSDIDILARRTASQFCVVLTRLEDAGRATTFAQHLRDLDKVPFRMGERDFHIGMELGIAMFPTDAMSAGGLLTFAEASAFGPLRLAA